MAVVATPFLATQPDPWATPKIAAPKGLISSRPMTDIMSYQYPPPPPQNGADMGLPPPGYMPEYAAIPPSSAIDLRSDQDSSISPRDRRDSISKALKLKRSMSSPSVRPQQPPPPVPQSTTPEHAGMGLGAAEKRRNKLGYHRTSVACGKSPLQSDVERQLLVCRLRFSRKCVFSDNRPRTLPTTKDQMHSVAGRLAGALC